jgi:group I intron endonuclease
MVIYKIQNKLNGKVYIGKTEKTIKERWKKHKQLAKRKINRVLYDAINKYGPDCFTVCEIDKANSIEELNQKEKYWIQKYNSTNRTFGYNMQDGGTGGIQPIEIRKKAGKKISITNRGRIVSKETREKISLAHVGMKHSEETKRKLSEYCIKIGRKPPICNHSGKNHPMFGKTHSTESKIKISAARKGKTYSEIFKNNNEKIERLKSIHKKMFLGSNNPLYVSIDLNKVKRMILNRISITNIAKECNTSKQTIYAKLKQIGLTPHSIRTNNGLKE